MNHRQKSGIGCFVLAVAFVGIAIKNTFVSPTVPLTDASGLGVSRLVGAFLPAIVALAVGVWLFQRQKKISRRGIATALSPTNWPPRERGMLEPLRGLIARPPCATEP